MFTFDLINWSKVKTMFYDILIRCGLCRVLRRFQHLKILRQARESSVTQWLYSGFTSELFYNTAVLQRPA